MKVGDLVRVYGDRVGIIVAYHREYDYRCNAYPWYVWINGSIEYYQTKNLELV
jgi:hypothetical protein